MIQVGRREIGITGFALRIIAVIAMVAAFIGREKGYGYGWLEAFGWTSFTIFAFLLVEGVAHSSNRRLYVRRFIVFGIISEFLYDWYMTGRTWFNGTRFLTFKNQSVMVTLFVMLLLMLLLTFIKSRYDNLVLNIILIIVFGYGICRLAELYSFQFGRYGILIILMFYLARIVHYPKLLEISVLLYICFLLTSDVLTVISIGRLQYPLAPQLYCFIALPFIWTYDGNRGPNQIPLQIAQYLVYPVCLLIFAIIKWH
jgi:hypothetical protein